MGIVTIVVVVAVIVAAVGAYQLYKSKKAVTVANVVAEVKTDAATVASDVKKS